MTGTFSLNEEYHMLEIRYKKLISEEKKLRQEHEQDVKYFISHNISDKQWQNNLEKTACYLASASVTRKIAKNKLEQIRTILFDGDSR